MMHKSEVCQFPTQYTEWVENVALRRREGTTTTSSGAIEVTQSTLLSAFSEENNKYTRLFPELVRSGLQIHRRPRCRPQLFAPQRFCLAM